MNAGAGLPSPGPAGFATGFAVPVLATGSTATGFAVPVLETGKGGGKAGACSGLTLSHASHPRIERRGLASANGSISTKTAPDFACAGEIINSVET